MRAPSFLLLGLSCLVPACSRADECRDLKAEAGALVSEFAACSTDADCRLVDLEEGLPGACLGAFQCFVALGEERSLEEFFRRARELEASFSDCAECARPECRRREGLRAICETSTGRCAAAPAPP